MEEQVNVDHGQSGGKMEWELKPEVIEELLNELKGHTNDKENTLEEKKPGSESLVTPVNEANELEDYDAIMAEEHEDGIGETEGRDETGSKVDRPRQASPDWPTLETCDQPVSYSQFAVHYEDVRILRKLIAQSLKDGPDCLVDIPRRNDGSCPAKWVRDIIEEMEDIMLEGMEQHAEKMSKTLSKAGTWLCDLSDIVGSSCGQPFDYISEMFRNKVKSANPDTPMSMTKEDITGKQHSVDSPKPSPKRTTTSSASMAPKTAGPKGGEAMEAMCSKGSREMDKRGPVRRTKSVGPAKKPSPPSTKKRTTGTSSRRSGYPEVSQRPVAHVRPLTTGTSSFGKRHPARSSHDKSDHRRGNNRGSMDSHSMREEFNIQCDENRSRRHDNEGSCSKRNKDSERSFARADRNHRRR